MKACAYGLLSYAILAGHNSGFLLGVESMHSSMKFAQLRTGCFKLLWLTLHFLLPGLHNIARISWQLHCIAPMVACC